MAAVTTQQSMPDQLETLLQRLLVGMAVPAPAPKPLLQCLLAGTQARQLVPVPVPAAGNSDLETLL